MKNILFILILLGLVVTAGVLVLLSTDKQEPSSVIDKMEYAATVPDYPVEENIKEDIEKIEEVEVKEMVATEVVEKPTIFKSFKEVKVTNGIKHTVPLNEIRGGGPAKDGIPSIDDPEFHSVQEASKLLDDSDIGLMVSINGDTRFYPFPILVRHEIVNDTFNGKRVLVTYCPLCLSGIVFDPIVDGERVEFGTSGKLWNSNLVMYDRKTDTYWSQVLGEAIMGEHAGVTLPILASDQIKFGEFRKQFPDAKVLTMKSTIFRNYSIDPYGDYYTDNEDIFFPVANTDSRLENKDFVLGIVIDGKAKAYYPPAVERVGEVVETFAGKTIVARYESDLDAVRIYEKMDDGTLERINPIANFWFSWVAVHPETELLK